MIRLFMELFWVVICCEMIFYGEKFYCRQTGVDLGKKISLHMLDRNG
jgi:hypothetical protein